MASWVPQACALSSLVLLSLHAYISSLSRISRMPRSSLAVLGAVVLERFRPVLLAFAALLLFSSAKMLLGGDEEEDDSMDDNAVVALVRRLLPVAPDYDGDSFFTQVDGVRTATPLLLVLVVIELSDLVFAVDSIPAVFGVTTDPFIVYSSNMFAIAVRVC
jgi:predicted tellurium resistance membrane protein TerC